MTKFQVGDKVRRIRENGCHNVLIGEIYTVSAVGDTGYPYQLISLKERPGAYHGGAYTSDYFSLVSCALETTITSRAIKGLEAAIARLDTEMAGHTHNSAYYRERAESMTVLADDHERQAAGNEAQIQRYRDALEYLGAVLADEELELEHA